MAIKKRKVPKRRTKPKPKLSAHELVCRALYNRLQDDADDDTVRYVLNKITPVEMSAHTAVQWLSMHCDTEINTLQINGLWPTGTFRVSMKYTDRTKKPLHGWNYPSVFVVKTSPVLIISVMLAYLELSKRLGRFPHEQGK